MTKYTKFKFTDNVLLDFDLPVIEYPVPLEKIKIIFEDSALINPSILIYWIMEYMNHNYDDREYYEKILLEICEKHAPNSGKTDFWYNVKSKYSQNPENIWCVKLGKVNLKNPIVSYQFGENIQLAVSRCEDDRTKIETTFFTVPHQDLIASLRCHSIDPHVNMLSRPEMADSFLNFQSLTQKMFNVLREGEKKDVIVNWEYGLGWHSQNNFNNKYEYSLNINPIPNDWVAFLFDIVLECETNNEFEKIVGLQTY